MAMHDALALGQCFSEAWEKPGDGPEASDDGLASWRLEAALAQYDKRRVDEVRRVVLASRHLERLRSGMVPEADGVTGGDSRSRRMWETVSEGEYEAAILACGVARPMQSQLMPAYADPLLSVTLTPLL